jgi:crotonobetainyl-CoA:carnitine CoA-transferase CaiB-like acyl-CoA transferase
MGMIGFGIADPNAGAHAVLSLLAALYHREAHGGGTFIDMSQVEAVLSVLPEAFAEAQLPPERPPRRTLTHPCYHPYGHFRCRGVDRWIALAIDSDTEFGRLREAIGIDLGRDDPELSRAIEAWSAERDRDDAVALLLSHAIRVAPLLTLEEMREHEQFAARGLFAEVDHPVTGPEPIARVPWNLARTPAQIRRAAPLVGADTWTVLDEWLGVDEDEARRLEATGVLR